ncbi:MAG: hypothetical protein ACLTSZ_04740 [Lachnospiraceae bacterium]
MIERDFDDNVEMAEDLRELLTPVFGRKGRKTGCGRKAVLQVPQQGWSDYDDCAGKWKDYDFRIVRGRDKSAFKSGQDITVHGADVKVGQTARSFTAGELQDPAALNAASTVTERREV